jgi:UDP-N-acetylglucosamine 4,6-dehydratase
MFKDKVILVTGGTGSFGKKFVQRILFNHPEIKKIIVFSRDELKQYEMAQEFNDSKYKQIRYFIGDVRDYDRLKRAFEQVDYVIHAAALKQVPAAEYNPMEFIKTNIMGAQNVINAALDNKVQKVVALSTDKAAAPINLYGATKLCSDKLFVAANNVRGGHSAVFSVVRYGNVLGSRGSVIPYFLEKRKQGVIPITHDKMTRFSITLDEGVDFVIDALNSSLGGEIFVPKIPSYKILDVAKAVAPNCKHEIVGIRAGEKIHEEMITESDSLNTYDCGKHYVLLPTKTTFKINEFIEKYKAKPVPENFRYNSGENDNWLSVEQIRQLIKEHIDPSFS